MSGKDTIETGTTEFHEWCIRQAHERTDLGVWGYKSGKCISDRHYRWENDERSFYGEGLLYQRCLFYDPESFWNWKLNLNGGDGGVDIVFRNWTLDSKFNHTRDGYLYFNELANFVADIGVLVVDSPDGNPLSMQFRGWIKWEDFIKKVEPLNFGKGKRIGVYHTELEDMPKLYQIEEGFPHYDERQGD